MKIELLVTVEQPIVVPLDTPFAPAVNEIAARGAHETARSVDEEVGVAKIVWKFPAGSIVDIPEKAANTLIGLGYARAI